MNRLLGITRDVLIMWGVIVVIIAATTQGFYGLLAILILSPVAILGGVITRRIFGLVRHVG